MLVGDKKKYTIPDKCPTNCRYHHMSEYREEKCKLCPIFNCVPDYDGLCEIPVDKYSSCLAKMWSVWFQTDMRGDVWTH